MRRIWIYLLWIFNSLVTLILFCLVSRGVIIFPKRIILNFTIRLNPYTIIM